jgi:hypothetical protein
MHSSTRRLCTLLIAIALCAVSARASDQGEPLLGRAGGVPVTEREFRERFELTPGLYRHKDSRLEAEKQEVIYSMVAEKLLAQEALARRLDADSLYQLALSEVTKLLARDASSSRIPQTPNRPGRALPPRPISTGCIGTPRSTHSGTPRPSSGGRRTPQSKTQHTRSPTGLSRNRWPPDRATTFWPSRSPRRIRGSHRWAALCSVSR